MEKEMGGCLLCLLGALVPPLGMDSSVTGEELSPYSLDGHAEFKADHLRLCICLQIPSDFPDVGKSHSGSSQKTWVWVPPTWTVWLWARCSKCLSDGRITRNRDVQRVYSRTGYSHPCPRSCIHHLLPKYYFREYIYIFFNELSKIDSFVGVFEEERRGNIISQRGQHTEILKLRRESSAFAIIISPPLSGLLQPHFGSVSFTLAWWHVTWPILDRGLASALLAQSLAVVAWVRVGGDIQKTQFSELFTQKGNLKESYPTSLGMCIMARNGAMAWAPTSGS